MGPHAQCNPTHIDIFTFTHPRRIRDGRSSSLVPADDPLGIDMFILTDVSTVTLNLIGIISPSTGNRLEKPRGNMTSEEVHFARHLASNDRKTRDRAVARLRTWLRLRSQKKVDEFDEDGMMKIWKGLFFSMWQADKPLVQEELADSISSLIHAFSKPSQIYVFVGCFFKLMGQNHDRIDKYRIDKFLMFTRRFFRLASRIMLGFLLL